MAASDLRRNPVALAIADVNLMACRLLSDQFQRQADIAVVACTSDRSSLLKSVRETKPDVAIIGVDLQDGRLSGLDAMRQVRETHPGLRPIMLFDRPEPQVVVEALRAGARGLFSRCDFDFAALRKCVRRVFEGQLWLGNIEMEFVLDALTQARPLRIANPDGLNLLTKREEQVMRLVAQGLGNRDIAEQINVREHTVKNYLFRIFDKLGVSNRVELVLYAVANPKGDALVSSDSEVEKLLGKALGKAFGQSA
jgi:DNA-binding NarL/FixJ family response regulator